MYFEYNVVDLALTGIMELLHKDVLHKYGTYVTMWGFDKPNLE